jgi:hypothetical protein
MRRMQSGRSTASSKCTTRASKSASDHRRRYPRMGPNACLPRRIAYRSERSLHHRAPYRRLIVVYSSNLAEVASTVRAARLGKCSVAMLPRNADSARRFPLRYLGGASRQQAGLFNQEISEVRPRSKCSDVVEADNQDPSAIHVRRLNDRPRLALSVCVPRDTRCRDEDPKARPTESELPIEPSDMAAVDGIIPIFALNQESVGERWEPFWMLEVPEHNVDFRCLSGAEEIHAGRLKPGDVWKQPGDEIFQRLAFGRTSGRATNCDSAGKFGDV